MSQTKAQLIDTLVASLLPATEFAPFPIFIELNTPSTLKVALPFESMVTLEPELVAKAKVLVADRNTPLAGALAVPVKFNA